MHTQPSTSGDINIENDPPEVLPVMVEDEAPTPPCDKKNNGTQKRL